MYIKIPDFVEKPLNSMIGVKKRSSGLAELPKSI
jgi:hypothetical protein